MAHRAGTSLPNLFTRRAGPQWRAMSNGSHEAPISLYKTVRHACALCACSCSQQERIRRQSGPIIRLSACASRRSSSSTGQRVLHRTLSAEVPTDAGVLLRDLEYLAHTQSWRYMTSGCTRVSVKYPSPPEVPGLLPCPKHQCSILRPNGTPPCRTSRTSWSSETCSCSYEWRSVFFVLGGSPLWDFNGGISRDD